MDTRKSKRDEYESDTTVAYLRRGTITILDALDVQLPDVFAAEILPKLSLKDTLNLAQVSKAYRDSVWSVRGVQSLEAKITAHFERVNHRKPNQGSLYYATMYGNLPAIRALLQSGVDVDEPLSEGVGGTHYTTSKITALWFASHRGDAALVKELIEAGADVNVRGSAKCYTSDASFSDITPLYAATNQDHTPVVMELIKAGADVNVTCCNGFTPIYIAVCKGYEACALALLQAGADVNNASTGFVTPLSAAIERKHEKVVKLLKHFGAR